MSIMRNPAKWFTVLVSIALPSMLNAQVAPLDSQQRAAVQATAQMMTKPAEFVLQHRTELELSAIQVARLEQLASAQRDSIPARSDRMMMQARSVAGSSAMAAVAGWTGPVDEQALREALCRQSAVQLESLLGIARDRRAVADLLTASQLAQLPRLQADEMIKAVKR
jgi:hypothetical protein